MQTISKKYKYFRNRVRELDRLDALTAIWAYDWAIANPREPLPSFCEFHPNFARKISTLDREAFFGRFKLSNIAMEIIQHSSENPSAVRTLRNVKDAHRIFAAFDEFLEAQYNEPSPHENVFLSLHRTVQQQGPWQSSKANSFDLSVYFNLYENPEIQEVLVSRIGLTFQQIYLIGVFFWLEFQKRPTSRRMKENKDLPEIDEAKIDAFLDAFSCNFDRLCEKLTATPNNLATHQYRFNPLLYYPIIRFVTDGPERFLCPHPELLFSRITSGLFFDLMGAKGFADAYGKAFNQTIGKVLAGSNDAGDKFSVCEEFTYKVGKNEVQSPDWIVHDGKNLMTVECKTKRPTFDYQAAENGLVDTERDLEFLADAIIQTHKRVMEREHWGLGQFQSVMPLVCCLENWILFGPETFGVLEQKIEEKLPNSERGILLRKQMSEFGYALCTPWELSMIVQIADIAGLETVFDRLRDPKKTYWLMGGKIKELARELKIDLNNSLSELCDEQHEKLIAKFNSLDGEVEDGGSDQGATRKARIVGILNGSTADIASLVTRKKRDWF